MKILQINNNEYKVYGDELRINEKLAPGVYDINFNQWSGFSLEGREPLKATEKLYGPHEKKVDRIIESYELFERSLGVIFSGDKGIGKTIAARMLSEKMVEKGYPVILAKEDIDGIADFIDSIQQECVILFDEFEKNFPMHKSNKENNGDENRQNSLLTLFDGTGSSTKRLYVITKQSAVKPPALAVGI